MSPGERRGRHPAGVPISGEDIRLDQFLKWVGAAASGGQAKALIQRGSVAVNGERETRRGRKLHPGDVVSIEADEGQGRLAYRVTRGGRDDS